MNRRHKERVLNAILEAVSNGVASGYARAYKHVDEPSEFEITEHQEARIIDNLWDIPEFADFFGDQWVEDDGEAA